MLTAKERQILDKIIIASENNPLLPEFPPDNPKFPATPLKKIQLFDFENLYIKDESKNPTGTHKDRMAWEIIVTYRALLLEKLRSNQFETLPSMSIISSGSAAIAIQTQFTKYELPNLKVLVDHSLSQASQSLLKDSGCELYFVDLSQKCFSSQEILSLTDNPDGFDLTSVKAIDPTTQFYDWLSYEVVNSSPDYCFIPFGSGALYENILNIVKKEVKASSRDPRFEGCIDIVRRCHFIGATVDSPASAATKLYSPFTPFLDFSDQWIRFYRMSGYCGQYSDVHVVAESFLKAAMEIAINYQIKTEPSGIAGLALLLQMQDKIDPNAKIVIINTGCSPA